MVFASGSGSNFQSILNAIDAGKLHANVSGLVVSRTNAGAIQKANSNGIPVHMHIESEFKSELEATNSLLNKMDEFSPDVIVLAGYLRKIPIELINRYKERILNIHPSLLPAYGGKGFYGIKVHEAVLENGESVSGCTVHLVTEQYDEGPILAQTKVPVYKHDTPSSLAARVLEQEHILYPAIIQEYILKSITL